jgi:hypothetical protein
MGCGASRQNSATVDSSYRQRKKHAFKDPGLEKHRQDCIKQKKKLRHVEDPEVNRKKKVEKIQAKNKKEAKVGATGLITADELQNARKNLRKQ